jgi:hypothetical protein
MFSGVGPPLSILSLPGYDAIQSGRRPDLNVEAVYSLEMLVFTYQTNVVIQITK